ncbi:MAG: NHL repeat-containing protein [Candidatus Dormibacteraceae bacterium]
MNGPDDLLYTGDGTVLVGEHGDGHIARVGGAAGLERLPQVIPEAEGIAQVNGTTYIADQFHARVVALTDTGVRTVLQLQPVASGENLDGMSANLKGDGLVVPDSPHGTVLQVGVSGNVVSRVSGFARPAGASPDPSAGGYLIADENASAVFELTGGTIKRLAGGLPGVDDAIRTDAGHVLVILPASGRLFDVTAGTNLATGLRNPQGLGFDGAQNVLLTESDSGRLDMVVNTFAITTPPANVQLAPGQPICYGVLRAPGFTDPVTVQEVVNGLPLTDPAGEAPGQLVPGRCIQPTCAVTLILKSGSKLEYASITYRD